MRLRISDDEIIKQIALSLVSVKAPTQKLPIEKVIYKYRNWRLNGKEHDDKVLTQQILHFSDPNCFDDKDDCRNIVDYRRLDKNVMLQDKFKVHLAVTHSPYNNLSLDIESIKRFCEKYKQDDFSEEGILLFKKKEWEDYCKIIGILSLSKNHKSKEMWESEYSSNYTGVCYAFDTDMLLKNFEVQGIVKFDHVEYKNEIGSLSVLSSSDEKMNIRKYVKLKDKYEFEDEFRLCLNAKNLTPEIRNLKYDLECIKFIIFGHNMSLDNFRDFISILDGKPDAVEIPLYYTAISEDKVDILGLKDRAYWK